MSISTLESEWPLVVVEHSTNVSFLLGLEAGISARLNLRDEQGTDETGDVRRTVAGPGADMRRPKRMSIRDVRELGRG